MRSFPYDTFCIVVLLVVGCGAIVVSLSQLEAIIYFADQLSFLLFTTIITLSLILSILAAFLKHQQSEYTDKVSETAERIKQLQERGGDEKIEKAILLLKRDIQRKNASGNKLGKMSGWAVRGSLLSIITGFMFMLVAVWYSPMAEMLAAEAETTAENEQGEEEEEEEE